MSLSVLFVMIGGNVIVSLLRNMIPDRIRIIVQLVVVASLVIIVDQVLKAFQPDISEKLSVFCWSDHNELHHYGTFGSIRIGE